IIPGIIPGIPGIACWFWSSLAMVSVSRGEFAACWTGAGGGEEHITKNSGARMARLENSEIAALFREMADLLQIQGGDRHRGAACRRAARLIEGLPRPAEELLQRGELDKFRGTGPGTVHRVKQMLRTHSCDDLDALRRKVPAGLREMVKIKGIGPTTVRNIHNRLGVETIEQLEHAAKLGGIEAIPRMGAATANKILAGIEAYRQRR